MNNVTFWKKNILSDSPVFKIWLSCRTLTRWSMSTISIVKGFGQFTWLILLLVLEKKNLMIYLAYLPSCYNVWVFWCIFLFVMKTPFNFSYDHPKRTCASCYKFFLKRLQDADSLACLETKRKISRVNEFCCKQTVFHFIPKIVFHFVAFRRKCVPLLIVDMAFWWLPERWEALQF